MVQDSLGPGYVPRGHEGGKQILVKEVEHDDSKSEEADEVRV